MRKRLSRAIFLFCWAWCLASLLPALDIPLGLANREAVARVQAPVTSGVPLPAGALSDGGPVRLLRGGAEIPAQFLPAAHWPDGSVRWLLVSFETNLPPAGTVSLVLQTGTAAAPATGLVLAD